MTSKNSQLAASPRLLFSLAEEYRRAALELEGLGRKGRPLSRAPFRFAAIHAIELYLSAVLLKGGREPKSVQEMGHSLKLRAELAKDVGLVLCPRAFAHLEKLEDSREYQAARYGWESLYTASPINRLAATLKDVATKSKPIVEAAELKPRPSPLCR